jgi:hypothetical protein
LEVTPSSSFTACGDRDHLNTTTTTTTTTTATSDFDPSDRPRKRLREQSKTIDFVPVLATPKNTTIPQKQSQQQEKKKQTSDLINKIPNDVVAHCLSFLGSADDRHSLQSTCKLFRDLSNADSMLANVNVAGDPETGKGCIIQEHDTPASAAEALSPFARAGNLEALYMYVQLSTDSTPGYFKNKIKNNRRRFDDCCSCPLLTTTLILSSFTSTTGWVL